jgi:hypothetical protein
MKLNLRRATSLPPHDRTGSFTPRLAKALTPSLDNGTVNLNKTLNSCLTSVAAHHALSSVQKQPQNNSVTPSFTLPQCFEPVRTTPIRNSTSTSFATPHTPSKSKPKGRKRTEDVNHITEEEFNEILEKLKAEVVAKGGNTFTCEHLGTNGSRCRTMQVDALDSRLCVSDFFGRNKSSTRLIKSPLTWCRKHYQRFSYQAKSWQGTKLFLIQEQLERIDCDDPGTTYNIKLKKSELKRLSEANNGDRVAVAGRPLKKDEAPIDSLQYIYDNILGDDKTKQDCEGFLRWCSQERAKGTFDIIPRVEMVPNLSDDASEEDSEDEIMTDVTPVTKVTIKKASRISQKGAIKKP